MEIAIILFSFFLLYPNGVFINRGNHEDHIMNLRYHWYFWTIFVGPLTSSTRATSVGARHATIQPPGHSQYNSLSDWLEKLFWVYFSKDKYDDNFA